MGHSSEDQRVVSALGEQPDWVTTTAVAGLTIENLLGGEGQVDRETREYIAPVPSRSQASRLLTTLGYTPAIRAPQWS